MGSKRPKNGRTGKKKGDKDTKGQRSTLEFTVKKTGDGGQALQDHVNELQRQQLARVNKPRDKDTKGQRSMLEFTVKKTGDGGQALQDHVNELQRQQLARVNKPRDKASQDDFDESKLQDYWAGIPKGDSDVYLQGLLQQHINFASKGGQQAGAPEVLGRWKDVLNDNFQGDEALRDRLCRFIDTTAQSHHHDDEDDGEPAQRIDPLNGAKARFPSQGTSKQGGSATKKPLYLLNKVIEYPNDLVEERRRQGRIELWGNVAEHVDHLYPGIKVERYNELCGVDPLYDDLDMDATPQNYVASIHNLYLDLRDCKWLHRDDLITGLRLVLLGREDVFLSPFDLGTADDGDVDLSPVKDLDWNRRRFHVALFIHNNNHFAVIIGDRETGKALYYDMMDVAVEVPGDVKDTYAKFLAAIGAPDVTLDRGKGPRQTDSNSCGLLVLEAVRHVFREHAGDIAEAGRNAFSVARSMTDILGEGPVSPGEESQVVVAKLRTAWLLCLEKELGGDGERRVLTGERLDADEPCGAALPCAYKKGVRLRGEHLPTSERVYYAAFPKDMVEHWTSDCRTSRNFADGALVKAGLVTSKENDERYEDFSRAYNEKFRQHDVSSLAQHDGDADLPTHHALDDLTGLPLADGGPYALSPDSNLQYTISEDGGGTTLGRHTATNLGVIARCTNWLLGSQFAYQDAAAAALLRRRLHNLDTPWQKRKEEVQFALNCLDNLAAARQVDPCRLSHHSFDYRCGKWKDQEKGDLKKSACFWARPERGNKYITELIDKRMSGEGVRQRAGVFFSLGLDHYYSTSGGMFAQADGRKGEYDNLHNNMWAAAHAKGLSKHEFEHFFLLHGVYFPFYTAARKYLPRPENWTITHLVALAREEVENGLKKCNDAAIKKGLGEGDLYKAENWTRVIFPIFLGALDKLIKVKTKLRRHWQSKGWALLGPNGQDDVFMDEVAHLLTDDMDNPIMPFSHHILRCTHEKRFDPRDIMLSGYQIGPNGMRFESAGPFTHPKDFHLMRSFKPWARTALFSSNLTNMIRGKEHHSLWEGSMALLLSISPDGPLSTLDRSLGEEPWAAAVPEACRGTPPDPTFDIDMPLPSADDLVVHGHGSRRGIRLGCPSCQGAQSQDLTPGDLLNHFLVEHSLLGGHRCEHCGLTCFDAEVLSFHLLLCFRDPVHLQQAFEYYQRFGHHVDGNEDCQYRTGGMRVYKASDLQSHLKICGKSTAERLAGQFCCRCGLAYSESHAAIVRHQSSEPHKKQMAYQNDPSTAGDLVPCPKCGILLGATRDTNKLHEKFCENIQTINASPDMFKIVEDGAAAQKDQGTMLKHFRVQAERLASPLIKEIARHPPPQPLPEDGVCGICLQKLTFNQTYNKNRHKGSDTHEAAHDLLKRLFGNVPEDDEKPADKKRLSELLSNLQEFYHGQTALPSELLDGLFIVHIPSDISAEGFYMLVVGNKYLTATFPPKWKKSASTTMERILDVRPELKPGKLDCLDCCLFGLHRSPSAVATSQHTSKIEHLAARGLIDGMLELMGPGTSRFDAVLEVQRRLLEARKRHLDNDSDSDSPRKPPRRKTKRAAGSPQAKKATSMPASQAKNPARKPHGGRGKGKAATGKSTGVQAAGTGIGLYFEPVPKPAPAGRKDDGGDGKDNGDPMDLDK